MGPIEEMSVWNAICGWKLRSCHATFQRQPQISAAATKIAATQRDTTKTQTCAVKGPFGDGDEPDKRRRALCAAGRDMAVFQMCQSKSE